MRGCPKKSGASGALISDLRSAMLAVPILTQSLCIIDVSQGAAASLSPSPSPSLFLCFIAFTSGLIAFYALVRRRLHVQLNLSSHDLST